MCVKPLNIFLLCNRWTVNGSLYYFWILFHWRDVKLQRKYF